MKRLLIGLSALALVGCTTPQIVTAHQAAEKAVIEADYLYVALASFANQQEFAGVWTQDQGEAIKKQAYAALLDVRHAYDLGQAVDLTALSALAGKYGIKGN